MGVWPWRLLRLCYLETAEQNYLHRVQEERKYNRGSEQAGHDGDRKRSHQNAIDG